MSTDERKISIELAVLSFLSLYAELLVIRWMSADIRAFTVFRFFPLMACFLGLGLGFAIGKDRLFRFTTLAIFLFALTMYLADYSSVCFWAFPSVSNFQWQYYDSVWQFAFPVTIVLLLAGPFGIMVCLGSRLGVLFNQLKPLHAYCWNILGSLTGTIIFPLLCYLGLAPWQLIVPLGVLCWWLAFKDTRFNWKWLVPVIGIPVVALAVPSHHSQILFKPLGQYQQGQAHTFWSPYQRIDVVLMQTRHGLQQDKPRFLGLELGAFRCFYQYYFRDDIDPKDIGGDMKLILAERDKQYSLPFLLSRPQKVLIVGAGTGQNVSYALKYGATTVDAVDIDPVILDIGRRYNPSYSSSKVNLVCDDARHYFSTCSKQYDLIDFSLLDSIVATGQGSSVRLDAYIYTQESLSKAVSLLKPNGILCLSFASPLPWLAERIYKTAREAVGYPPLVLLDKNASLWGQADYFFVLGQGVKEGQVSVPDGWRKIDFPLQNQGLRTVTDDWPFLYVRPDEFDILYYLVVGELLLISVLVTRRHLFGSPDPRCWQMFFLGAGFLLLELHAIAFLSLLYGSTWMTSALVISGVLLLILIANVVVIKGGAAIARKQSLFYLLLFASILGSYWTPGSEMVTLVGHTDWLRYLLVTLCTLLPMGIAGIIFATSFSLINTPARGLAFNLFGALVGGLLEYASTYYGLKSLELIALALYGCSFICVSKTAKPAIETTS